MTKKSQKLSDQKTTKPSNSDAPSIKKKPPKDLKINEEIAEGDGTMSYGTKAPLDTFVDICLGKKVDNHANGEVSVKTV